MKITPRKIRLAWKYRALLWRYRNVIRHRRAIGAIAAAGTVVTAGLLVKRARRLPA
jgi:hypothetical protein